MATESNLTPQAGLPEGSVIENEIPAYRAISAAAVTSLVLGCCAVFCFTSLWFLVVVAVAVLFGVQAIRSIKRLPDVLTGTKIAQTGIGLALAFGLSATAQVLAEDWMLDREASAFTRMYLDVLKNKPLATAVWYTQAPDFRKTKTPDEVVEELKKAKNPTNQSVFDEQTDEIQAIKRRLAAPQQEIHFRRIETKLVDGLTHYANALVDVDGPATAEFPEAEQFALVQLIKPPGGGSGDWRIREINYPYKPATAGLHKEQKDDGHGHSH